MMTRGMRYAGLAALAIVVVWAGSAVRLGAQQAATGGVPIDGDDIGGVVSGPKGPEAGVKDRGPWTTSGDRTAWLKEGGKGTKPLVVHFQLRPDPLAH